MNITTPASLVGFLLTLSVLSVPAADATPSQPTANTSPSIEGRLDRIATAIRQREAQVQNPEMPKNGLLMAYGFGDGSRGGAWNQYARGGTATGAGGGTFNNVHPTYGGGGAWRDSGGFANGAYGGGGAFANGAYGGAGWRNY